MSKRFNPYGRFNGIFIPEQICVSGELHPISKLIYGRLARYAGKDGRCDPEQETLSSELGTSLSSVKRAIKELVSLKLIEVERGNRLRNENNKYHFLEHSMLGFSIGQNDTYEQVKMNFPTGQNDTSTTGQNDTSYKGRRESVEESHKKLKQKKNVYGEFENVHLTDTHIGKLREKFPSDWENRIERLSTWKASTGKKYANDYATIISWSMNNGSKNNSASTGVQEMKQDNSNYDFSFPGGK